MPLNKNRRHRELHQRYTLRDRGVDSFGEVSNISFKIKVVVTSCFNTYQKTHYQELLLTRILELHNDGWNTGEIARTLAEQGYLSVRGKPLLSKHVWSMLKKNQLRKAKINKEPQVELIDISLKSRQN